MRTTNIDGNLIQLTRLGLVNAFLVREDDGFTLIDTNLPGSAGDIIGAADAAGAPITRIAATHGHADHVGSLDALKERLPDSVEVLIPEIDARILAGEQKKTSGSWKELKTTPDVRLQGGERVGSLEVVQSPGHTPGHVAFLDTRSRALIAGDVFVTVGGVAVSNHFHWQFPLAMFGTWDKAKDLDSARRLRELEPTVLAVGHGGAVREPGQRIDRAIARAQ